MLSRIQLYNIMSNYGGSYYTHLFYVRPMQEDGSTAVAEPVISTVRRKKERANQKPKRQPRYHVILWDDDDHSYEYVMVMLNELFGHELEKGYQLAKKVDGDGKCVVLTTTMEHAELKRDQIHGYGRDALIERCKGSMSASIEPESSDSDN